VISSRKKQNVDRTVEQLRSKGISCLGVVCHVSLAQDRRRLVEETVQNFGRVDILVSNAATNPVFGAILDVCAGTYIFMRDL